MWLGFAGVFFFAFFYVGYVVLPASSSAVGPDAGLLACAFICLGAWMAKNVD